MTITITIEREGAGEVKASDLAVLLSDAEVALGQVAEGPGDFALHRIVVGFRGVSAQSGVSKRFATGLSRGK